MSDVARAVMIGAACLILGGCPKKENTDAKTDAGADAGAATSASADAAAEGGASTGAAAGASFAGKYVVSTGTMYVPAGKDYASVKFKNDDSKLLGEGGVTLSIDGAGRVSGATEGGPLGPGILEGLRDGQSLSATLRRKDPTDDGLTGTLVATIIGEKIEGTMMLAESNAAVVRVATLTATKK